MPILFSTFPVTLTEVPQLYECLGCNSLFTQNIVPEGIAGDLYERGKSSDKWPRSPDLVEQKSAVILSRLNQYCGEGKKVLDIGCNTGILLDYARKRGCETSGVEPSSASQEILVAKGHAVFSSIDVVTGTYDLITAFDLVEHLYDVPGFFRAAADLLVRDGMILLLTGDIHSFSARLSKAQWWYFKAPEHIVCLSRQFFKGISLFGVVSIDETYASIGYDRWRLLGIAQYLRKRLLARPYEGLPSIGPDHILVALKKSENA